MKSKVQGFTLIELLVTVSLIAVLASLAAPSFRTFLLKRTVQAAAQSLVTDMRFARSEAMRRNLPVTVCNFAANSTTSCIAGLATPNWANGWMVFVDSSNRGVLDAGEEVIRIQQPLSNMSAIQNITGAAATHAFFTYEVNGWARVNNNGDQFVFTPIGSVPANTTRLVCISPTGRSSLYSVGASGC